VAVGEGRLSDKIGTKIPARPIRSRVKALEVLCIESQQPMLAMRDHRGDDIGITNLTTSKSELAAQFGERVPYCRSVLQDGEPSAGVVPEI
jgi:hypothetical protein